MTWLVALCAVVDAALLFAVAHRVARSRRDGLSLRVMIFGGLAAATLVGALLTGTYTIAEEAWRTGVTPVVTRIAPKAFVVGSALLVLSAAGATYAGRRMSRAIEEITEAATRIAEGELRAPLPRGSGREARSLARALSSMRRELEGRPYAAAFLRDAWHDLKTPAAAIKATVELLADGAIDDRDAALRFLENLRRSSEQLERTIADLVTLSRFETATLPPDETVAVGALVEAAIDATRPLADARGVSLEARPVTGGPALADVGLLRCDPSAISRAIGNLLDNAIAATPPGGRVTVAVDDTPSSGVVLEVENTPASVAAEVRDRLFERAATSRKGTGSGLGLAIARAAVEAHGGRVRFVDLGPPSVKVRCELPR